MHNKNQSKKAALTAALIKKITAAHLTADELAQVKGKAQEIVDRHANDETDSGAYVGAIVEQLDLDIDISGGGME